MVNIEDNLKKVGEEIEKFNNALYELEDLDVENLVDIKVSKKQRMEMGTKILKEKLPKLYKLLFETQLVSEVITDKITDLKERLDEAQSDLDDIESSRDEVQDRLRGLGL
jgi:septation ring formation regulator EzrA